VLLYVVLACAAGRPLPLALAGTLLSSRSAQNCAPLKSRYRQLVRDKARQIELYGQRYRDVVSGIARAFEIDGGIRSLTDAGTYAVSNELAG